MIQLTDLPSDLLIHIAAFLPEYDGLYFKASERVVFAGVLNNYDMLEYYRKICDTEYDKRCFMNSLAYSGNLRAVQWARKQGTPIDEWTCSAAAINGNLEMLQWLHSEGCPWNEGTCSAAARHGNFDILQWLHIQGCPWNEETCEGAAYSGNLDMLQWLHSQGCPWNEETCKAAAENGRWYILQWLIDHGCPEPMDDDEYLEMKSRLI